MIPFNVLNSDKLDFPYLNKTLRHHRTLPKAHCIQMKADNELSIKRSILHLVTLPHLRAVHVFRFEAEHTDYFLFEPNGSSVTKEEAKGTLALAIQHVQQGTSSKMTQIQAYAYRFIHNRKAIIAFLESFAKEERLFIVLCFKEHLFSSGNYYDETSLCRAMLAYQPVPKPPQKTVIRRMETTKHILGVIKNDKDNRRN